MSDTMKRRITYTKKRNRYTRDRENVGRRKWDRVWRRLALREA